MQVRTCLLHPPHFPHRRWWNGVDRKYSLPFQPGKSICRRKESIILLSIWTSTFASDSSRYWSLCLLAHQLPLHLRGSSAVCRILEQLKIISLHTCRSGSQTSTVNICNPTESKMDCYSLLQPSALQIFWNKSPTFLDRWLLETGGSHHLNRVEINR